MDINVQCPDGSKQRIHYDRDPDVCPVCHRSVSPTRIGGAMLENSSIGPMQIIYQCTSDACHEFFIATYIQTTAPRQTRHDLLRAEPRAPESSQWGDEINALSAQFVTIYDQAVAAEAYGLDQIAGLGFRKSLEFLVKDYAISEKPKDGDKIKSSTLGACIKSYVSDASAQMAAERAAWLGNDEAHYLRKWEDHDISDLKTLIRLVENSIENVLLTKRYKKEMAGKPAKEPSKNKP